MRTGFLIGRLIAGVYYLYSGAAGLARVSAMAGYAASKGVPSPTAAVLLAHVLLIIAGLCLLTGFRPVVGIVALALFFIPVTFTMHAFWAERDAASQMNQMIHFTKNLALLGSSLMLLAIPRPWPWSVESARLRRLPGGPGRTLPANA